MTQAEKNTGKVTFGNILLVLLVIGTFIVGGLMYKLYQQLTETPEKTANWHEQQKTQQIEMMSPNGKPSDSTYRPAGTSTPAVQPAQTQAPTPEPQASEPAAVNNEALTAGGTPAAARSKQPVTTPKKTNAQANGETERALKPVPQSDNSLPGEVPLRPTNVAPKQPAEPKERPLKPQSPANQKSNGDEIGELF